MRKLVWAAIGFSSAAFLAEYLLPAPGLPYLAAALVFLALPPLLLRRIRFRAQAALLLLSAAAGMLYWWGCYSLRVAPCEALAGEDTVITARVTDWPLEREHYTRLSVTVTDGAPHERAYIYLYEGELPDLEPGDVISCELRVRSVMHRGEERSHTAVSAGRYLTGYIRGDVTVVGSSRRWMYFPQRIARYVSRTCEELFPGRIGVFMKALLTGDKEELYDDVELYGDMRAAGVLHAVAVSGMHVFLLVWFIRFLFGRGKLTTLLCIPVMGVFVLMSGAGASVVRAAVMQTIYMGAPLVDRESDSPSALSAALLLLLLINPMSIGGVGLQLSFACMAGYAVFMPPLLHWISDARPLRNRLAGGIARNMAATFSATAFSIPIAAYYFGTVPLLAVVTNVLALPVIELCFAGGYVLCAMRAVLPLLARWGAWLLAWGVRYCLLVFRWIGRLPFACLYTADPKAVVWLIFSYLLCIGWLVLRRRGIRVRPLVPAALIVIGLSAIVLGNRAALLFGRREISVLDVDQGECVVLLDEDASVVVDCGGTGWINAGNAAADWLISAGKRKIDVVVLTHLHEDHTNGVETLLYRLPVGTIVLPADAEDDGMLAGILDAAARHGTDVLFLSEDGELVLGGLTLDLLLPQAGTDDNERGIAAYAAFPGRTALIMGDAGTAAELSLLASGLASDTNVLVVGHHGSKTASGAMFLKALQPDTAVISVGYNSYGQPADEVLDRLARYCGEVLRTDEDGTVTISMKQTEE